MDASKRWTMPIHHWKQALNRFMIMFEDRLTEYLSPRAVTQNYLQGQKTNSTLIFFSVAIQELFAKKLISRDIRSANFVELPVLY
jgi:hypothetical protein